MKTGNFSKKANDMIIVLAADKAAKDMSEDPEEIEEDTEEMEHVKCPKCKYKGQPSEFGC